MELVEILSGIYGSETAADIMPELKNRIRIFKDKELFQSTFGLSEHDSMLITYGDMTQSTETTNPLQTLKDFLLEYAEDIITTVHILPFFPYSSDDGFSVINYREVNPYLGTWKDMENFSDNFRMAFDTVFNHISQKSDWFQGFLNKNEKYSNWFIEPDKDFDSSKVFRPRALPLFNNYEDITGEVHKIWTTFSKDQVDLNFKSPELLLELIDILLLYIEKGAGIIRLDAIAFCWKESGTACLHLHQAHLIVKLFRKIADEVMPGTIILTETNVPHKDNISYFGNHDEAHMVYQFPLPPLTAQAILRQNATALTDWATNLEEAPPGCTFLNFLASPDGVGVRPLVGLAPESELYYLAEESKRKGGKVGYKNNPDGSQSPYELNISYFNLVTEPEEELELSVKKFMLSQAIMLAMPGVPGIYFHSLFGSVNWTENLPEDAENRTINREKIPAEILRQELDTEGSRRQMIYSEYQKLLTIRKQHKAFHPKSGFEILHISPEIFGIIRGTSHEEPLLAIFNVSSKEQSIEVHHPLIHKKMRSLLSCKKVKRSEIKIAPYEFEWLIPKKKKLQE